MSKYRESFHVGLRIAGARTQNGLDIFFSRNLHEKDRLAGLRQAGSFSDKSDILRGRAVLDDVSEPAAIRSAALRGLVHQLANDEEMMTELIGILGREGEPYILKRAALSSLQCMAFASPLFAARRQAYLGALQNLLRQGPEPLRLQAIEYLALNRDRTVQELLAAGLEHPAKALVEPERAIQLLSYDMQPKHYSLMRQIALNPPNAQSRLGALRNLGSGEEDLGILQGVLSSRAEEPGTRLLCAQSLAANNPAALFVLLKILLLEEEENMELKTGLLNIAAHSDKVQELFKDRAFMIALESSQRKSRNGDFKAMYVLFHNIAARDREGTLF